MVALNGAGTAMTLAGDLQIGSINLANLSYGNGELQFLTGRPRPTRTRSWTDFTRVLSKTLILSVVANGFPSSWTTKGNLTVGQNYTGLVYVLTGALMVVDGNLIVGQNIIANSSNSDTGQSTGTIIVENPGTTFNDFGATTTIGAAGQGLIDVSEGAAGQL